MQAPKNERWGYPASRKLRSMSVRDTSKAEPIRIISAAFRKHEDEEIIILTHNSQMHTATVPSSSSCTLTQRQRHSHKDMLHAHLLTSWALAAETHRHHGTNALTQMHQRSDLCPLAPHTHTHLCMPQGIQMPLFLNDPLGLSTAIISQMTDYRLFCWQWSTWPTVDPEEWWVKHVDHTAKNIRWSKGPQNKVEINRIIHPPLPIPNQRALSCHPEKGQPSLC